MRTTGRANFLGRHERILRTNTLLRAFDALEHEVYSRVYLLLLLLILKIYFYSDPSSFGISLNTKINS